MLDVKLILAAGLAAPLLSVSALGPEAGLTMVVVCSALGAYSLVASEVIAMLLGERVLPAEAKRLWWALAILRFTVGLPLGAFAGMAWLIWQPSVHQWVGGIVAYIAGWSGLALKPQLDRVFARKLERLGGPEIARVQS